MEKQSIFNFITDELSHYKNLLIAFYGDNSIHIINNKVRSLSFFLEYNSEKEFYYIYGAQKVSSDQIDQIKLKHTIGKIYSNEDLKIFISAVKSLYHLSGK